MRCPRCQHDNPDGERSCKSCGMAVVPVDVERVRAQLKRWQERLLDLTKGNPLLGINRSRVSKLRVIAPAPEMLFAQFALADDTSLTLPRSIKVAGREGEDSAAENAEYRIEPGDLSFDAAAVDLHRRLRRIYDNARTTVEERGVTTLHLSFGVLRWNDPMLGMSLSPLWLVPCALESRGPSAPLRLVRVDEEMLLNPALALYLRERHRIELAELPADPTQSSLGTFLGLVQASVREVGWTAEAQVWLSTYSFESLAIYQDLKSLAEIAIGNEVVIALSRAAALREGSEALGEEVLDSLPTPEQVPVAVLQTDSSQLAALTTARGGRHLVIHGPPGTGKSQTIANLIADAMAQGKKVLFVSAKMAALDVVYNRLTALGLERFCLEAHSTKAGKLKIIEALKALDAATNGQAVSNDDSVTDLVRVREELNTYVRQLHEVREPLGLSIFQALGLAERLRGASDVRGPLPWSDPPAVSRPDLKRAVEALRDLAAQAEIFDRRVAHPWRGLVVETDAPPRRDALEIDLIATRDAVDALTAQLAGLAPLLGGSGSFTISTLRHLTEPLRQVAALDRLPDRWAARDVSELLSTASLLDLAAKRAGELAAAKTDHEHTFSLLPDATVRLLQPVEAEFHTLGRVFSVAYWRWRAQVRAKGRPGVSISIASLRSYLSRARRIKDLEDWFAGQAAAIHSEVGSEAIEPVALAAAGKRLGITAVLRRALDVARVSPTEPATCLSNNIQRCAVAMASVAVSPELGATLTRLDHAWPKGFVDGVPSAEASLNTLRDRCEEILTAQPKFQEWIALQHTLQRCHQLRLASYSDALGTLSARVAPASLERRFYSVWIESITYRCPALVAFSGSRREDLIARYRELDVAARRAALARSARAAAAPARQIAAAKGGGGEASEVGILRREMEKRRRLKPLRTLFAEIPTVLQGLKPCFLMSPLSVSTFLKPGALAFDLVVFDEASQLPTPQAIPAIVRAKQVVVAGDPKQLPPTSFFVSSVILDEEGDAALHEELEPLESLLDDCVAIFPTFEQAHLRWHYRSHDERLINFSNHYFYQDRPLITFPCVAADSKDRGVSLVHMPAGIWDRGGSRTNRAEARRVAEIVIDQLRRQPERSLGVVAMNVTQREAIEEEIEAQLADGKELVPLLDARRPEPFFIKALENVQGDERDTIIISIGYAKSQTGGLAYNFGPLNMEGGWRRLNVLVTRARWQTILVTSLRSHELSGVNPENRGAVALRNFIAYAERGGVLPAHTAIATDGETNDFEDEVAAALRERGFHVDQQVGASAYRIDLAVRDPRDAGRYLLGVECDGAMYHSSPTARDRDLLRQEVLHDQGWRLHRVWSTEWFHDREAALTKLLSSIEQARMAPLTDVFAPPKRRVTTEETDGNAQQGTPNDSAPVARRFPPGELYKKYTAAGRRDILLDRNSTGELILQVIGIVEVGGPIHPDVLLERLKESNGVDRAGANIQRNLERAIAVAVSRGRLLQNDGFITLPGRRMQAFRIPGAGVTRQLAHIAPDEIAAAVLYKVEDQFGYQRDALPRAVAELLGFDRLPPGGPEIVGTPAQMPLRPLTPYVSRPGRYSSARIPKVHATAA